MRIHAVAGGFNGNNNIQYVELRLDMAGHNLVVGHTIQFFDATGLLKATFTFPASVTNGAMGDSILVATSEFNGNVTGGTSDFTFSAANTTGANGGDPLHPVQVPGSSVVWAGATGVCFTLMPPPVDDAAYGGATAVYGTAAVPLPNPGTMQALRLSNLNNPPTNNSTEYSLQNVATSTFSVAPAMVATDFTSPRNNARTVLMLNAAPPSVGGLAEAPALAPASAATGQPSGGAGAVAFAGGIAAAAIASGAAWYVYRRRAS